MSTNENNDITILGSNANTTIDLEDTFIPGIEQNNISNTENNNSVQNRNTIAMPPGNEIDGYLFDIYEEDNYLFLFLKVLIDNIYKTICVQIEEPRYYLYFLPIDKEKKNDLVEEVREIAKKCGGYLIESKKQNLYQTKFYAFDNALIPNEGEWLCASFSRKSNLSLISPTGKNYQFVFGLTDRLTDCFCIHNLIKGPQWVHITKLEQINDNKYTNLPTFKIKNPKRVTLLNDNSKKIPDFNICSLALRYIHDIPSNEDRILMISMKIRDHCDIEKYKSTKKTVTFVKTDQNLASTVDNSIACANESQLLELFFDTLDECEADIIVSYNVQSDFQLIKQRMAALKIEEKCRIGRMSFVPGDGVTSPHHPRGGRLLVNLRSMCDEFIKSLSCSFNHIVAQEFDNVYRQPLENVDIVKEIKNDASKLVSLVKYNARDASFVDALVKKMNLFPLTLQLSQLSGCAWYRILGGPNKGGSASSRCESLFVHTFTELGYIIPEKYHQQTQAQQMQLQPNSSSSVEDGGGAAGDDGEFGRRVPQYKGGLVLEPSTGFYDNCVLVLDFNSLYPSIIREFNLCFTTIGYEKLDTDEMRVQLALRTKSEKQPGVLPSIMSGLLEERSKVKAELAEVASHVTHSNARLSESEKEVEKSWRLREKMLRIQQQALKILANAMYGYLGFPYSRFPAINIAEMVTCLGRHILHQTVAQITTMGHTVVYGDTDSVMIRTSTKDCRVALKTAQTISSQISSQYNHLKLNVESIFIKFLLLNKKKYAALVYEPTTTTTNNSINNDNVSGANDNSAIFEGGFDSGDVKELRKNTWMKIIGLEIIRREWCPLSKYLCTFALESFMYSSSQSDASKRIFNEVRRVTSMLMNDGQPTSSTALADKKLSFENSLKTEITVDDLIISKGIMKPLDQYKPSDKTFNVNVARWMDKHGHHVRAKDVIPYVVVDNKAKEADKRAKHPDVVFNVCEADIEYYLTNQLLPPLLRMCEPFQSPTEEMLEKAFMLVVKNPTAMKKTYYMSSSKKFVSDHKILSLFYFTCPICNTQCLVKNLIDKSAKSAEITCPSCSGKMTWKAAFNAIVSFVRRTIESWVRTCTMCSCGYLSEIGRLPMTADHRSSRGTKCARQIQAEVANTDVLRTLMGFKKVVDEAKVDGSDELAVLRDRVAGYLAEVISMHGLNRIQFRSIMSVEPFFSLSSD